MAKKEMTVRAMLGHAMQAATISRTDGLSFCLITNLIVYRLL